MNVDRPNGLRPAKKLDGSPWNGQLRRYTAADRTADAANNHGDIYVGDIVTLDAAGLALVANSGDTQVGVVVSVGTSTTTFGETGPFDADNLGRRFLPFNEAGDVWVAVPNNVLFEVQTATGVAPAPVVGALADISTAAGAVHGSRVTSQSDAELVAVAANNDVQVVEVVTTPDNDLTLENAVVLVKLNNLLIS